MKGMATFLTILLTISKINALDINLIDTSFNPLIDPDPQFVKKQESPWPGAVIVTQTIHKKEVELAFTGHKVTALGYGQMTPKVISHELAKHTLLDHRNLGEEGPCLAGEVVFGQPVNTQLNVTFPVREMVTIELRNRYAINHNRGICEVSLEEIVEVEIDGQKFSHHLTKSMGHRFIDDCTISE